MMIHLIFQMDAGPESPPPGIFGTLSRNLFLQKTLYVVTLAAAQ